MPRYVKSHTVQLVNPKIARLREEHGLAAYGAFHNVLLAAKDQNPAGRFLDRSYLDDALWPESLEHVDALLECGLLVVRPDGQIAVSGWNKWQSADKKQLQADELSEADRKRRREKEAEKKANQRRCVECGGYIRDKTPKERLEPGIYRHVECPVVPPRVPSVSRPVVPPQGDTDVPSVSRNVPPQYTHNVLRDRPESVPVPSESFVTEGDSLPDVKAASAEKLREAAAEAQRLRWPCGKKACRERFATEAELREHVEATHPWRLPAIADAEWRYATGEVVVAGDDDELPF